MTETTDHWLDRRSRIADAVVALVATVMLVLALPSCSGDTAEGDNGNAPVSDIPGGAEPAPGDPDIGGGIDPAPPDPDIGGGIEPAPLDPEVYLPYEPYGPPEIPHTESCLYAGDPLCDTTIEVPAPDLSGW
jgi:hypothetical protein